MISVRDAFFNKIYDMSKAGEEIYIVSADLGAPSLDLFRKDFPERFINVGIAEQNLISVASGLASYGKKVIAYGLNPFPVTRAFDQIRCLMGEKNIPITLCALNAGLCSAECGFTHLPIEDMALIRTLPNVEIFNPTDESISELLAEQTINNKKPRFIRFDKYLKGTIYEKTEIDNKKGFVVSGNKKGKICVVSYGIFAKELCDSYYKNSVCEEIKIIDLFHLPFDNEAFIDEISKCRLLISVEENVKDGGLGSLLLELFSDNNINIAIYRFGLEKKTYDVYTDRAYVRTKQGLDINSILAFINNLKDY